MTHDCRRWMALSDEEAQGDSLSEGELRWQRAHVKRCAACATEARFWSDVEDLLQHPEHLEQTPRALRPEQPRRRLGWLLAAGLLLTLGGTAFRWYLTHPIQSRRTERPSPPRPSTLQLLAASGKVSHGSEPAQAGQTLLSRDSLGTQTGRACVGQAENLITCLFDRSQADLVVDPKFGIRIRLNQGRILAKLARQPEGRPFSIETAFGTVTAKGTLFSVELDGAPQPRRATVRLYEGQLAVVTVNGRTERLVAPIAAQMKNTLERVELDVGDHEPDRELVDLARFLFAPHTSGNQVYVKLATDPSTAQVTLDSVPLGPTPLSALVPSGRRLQVALAGYATIDEVLSSRDGQTVERFFKLSPLPPLPSASAPVVEQPIATGAAELLSQAQRLRAKGDYEAAAGRYRRLVGTYPNSNEAHVSRVSLGELLLRQLGQPEAALRAFDQYLERGGPLTREARYGKIQALELLGRKDETQALVRLFLRNHPQSVQAETLRRKYAIP